MILIPILLVCAGLAIVVLSAGEAIKRLLNLAKHFHLSEFVASFVIAGMIAVLPELTIGVASALGGTSSLGFGVILGANVADLTLVIGAVVLFTGKLKLDSNMLKHMRMSFFAVLLPVLLFIDGEISQIDGAILLVAFTYYVSVLLRTKRDEPEVTGNNKKRRFIIEMAVLVASMIILFIGGTLITQNSQELSISLGLPLFLIGVLIAVGTCLPEMIFAIRASKKKHGELGLGNIIGNVLADSMLTIGVIALIQPIKPTAPYSAFTTALFMAISVLVVYILSSDGELDRKDGALLVIIYGAFLAMQSIIEALGI